MTPQLRVIVADDEGPARRFLIDLLDQCGGVTVVAEATDGEEAIELIEAERPDLALLDLQMPGASGLVVARRVAPEALPLFAFVTAHDDHAIEAFEVNAIDYLVKPVGLERLEATLTRARERRRGTETSSERSAALARASAVLELGPSATPRGYLDRIPVRRNDDTVLVPARSVACVTADGELLHIVTTGGERFTITHRLHLLEARLDPRKFVRLGRGTLANVELIAKVSPMPGGTAVVRLTTGQDLQVSRIQFRQLRDTLLRL